MRNVRVQVSSAAASTAVMRNVRVQVSSAAASTAVMRNVRVQVSSAAASTAVMKTISDRGDGLGAVRMHRVRLATSCTSLAHAVHGMHAKYSVGVPRSVGY
jgi:hypothetical protein